MWLETHVSVTEIGVKEKQHFFSLKCRINETLKLSSILISGNDQAATAAQW